jgi:nitroimidazol reductase NimA-like FMN-containing flavoprotein (pyridoxamine 5'-phosphate oxidase superfamily)
MQEQMPPSERTRIRRVPLRGHYDRETVHAIVDAAYLCHVAFADAHGVHCIPTACWREGDHLYIHGSNGSRMLRALAKGEQACVTITHLDGLVLARSAFHHSMNYRSVVVYGCFEGVPADHKPASLDRFMDRIAPGRRQQVRPGDASELAATMMLRMPLQESSAKVRSGGPKDDDADMVIPAWAGVLPITVGHGTPQPDGDIAREAPDYVRNWTATAG